MVVLDKITNVYRFDVFKDFWERNGAEDNFIAYKLYGSTLHRFEGKETVFKKDMLMTAGREDCYSVLSNENTGTGGCIAVHFTSLTPFDMHVSFFDCSSQPRIRAAFFKILDSWERFASGGSASAEYECISLFYHLMSLISEIKRIKITPVEEAKKYIERNYFDSQLSVEDVAAHVLLSSRRVSKLFSDEYGETPKKYINSLRLGRAEELLKQNNENMPISDIAAQCGYSSAAYFIRVFKEETGETPASFRRHG